MVTAPLTFGSLVFNAPMDWTFYPQGALVLGRPPTRAGLLKISTEFRDALDPRSASHDECWDVATRLSPPADSITLADQERRFIDFLPFGAATYRSGDDLTRIWYRCTHEGLIVASFGIPEIRAEEAETLVSIEDVSGMIRSAKFAPLEV
jgi:hypothetical protein